MNPVYTGILQQQKDKQLQGPSKEAWSMDRTGDKLLQCWSRMQHQRWDCIQVHLQHSLGLDLSLHGDPNITGRGPTYSSPEQQRYSSFSGPSQRIIQVLKKHRVQMPLILLVCFAVICFSVIFSPSIIFSFPQTGDLFTAQGAVVILFLASFPSVILLSQTTARLVTCCVGHLIVHLLAVVLFDIALTHK